MANRLLLAFLALFACAGLVAAYCVTDADCPSSYCVNYACVRRPRARARAPRGRRGGARVRRVPGPRHGAGARGVRSGKVPPFVCHGCGDYCCETDAQCQAKCDPAAYCMKYP